MTSQVEELLRRADRDGLDSLAQYERDYIAVWELHAETSNGSLDQYFVNSSGDHALEALQALRTIGAARAAEVLQRAIDVFGVGGYTTDTQLRNSRLNAIPDDDRDPAFTLLTDEFYDSVDEINERLEVYISEHRRPPNA
jgi:hypothetical protein